ncbi:MAG: hypothetical protein SPI94_03135 [Candidatus Onthovivens sp.]|nr:hypothetical protein [Mollicutes bacterium]MCI7797617.1 hypothetical protein [Mollicutes bacterium]MDD7622091.1 hypothetical protein [Bacilli bacterium]MDY5929125.1 hypothetical protein [Candidatus Onthovivens sp.]MDY5984447.1 hypothetical protein [Candidatus Onthovivens sp.]
MKTAVKVLTILGVASCFISLITLLFNIGNIDYFIDSINADGTLTTTQIEMLTSIYKFVFVIGILQSIAGIAIGIIHTVFLFKNKTKKQCLPTSILTLIFVNLIAGILSLCMKDEQYTL